MDTSKAKKAKSKAKARTKSTAEANAMQQQALAQAGNNPRAGVTPEIQAQQIAMQDRTQTVNPYHMMGAMPPLQYSPGNVVSGGYPAT